MSAPVRAVDPLYLRLPRADIARIKRAAADVNMSVNAYACAILGGKTPTSEPGSDMQYLGVAGSAIIAALRIAEAKGDPEIIAALRQARLAMFDQIVPRADAYDDAIVEKQSADYRWRTTTRTKPKL